MGDEGTVEERALRSLGLGFDLTNDFHLRFAKGYPGRRLVELDEERTWDIAIPGGPTIRGATRDVGFDKGDRTRFCSDVLEFNQVLSDRKPVVGLRLYLEGRKCNRLAIHVQHLSSLPRILRASASEMCVWQGSEDSDPAFIEPIRWRRYSSVCTTTVKHDPEWLHRASDGVFVVAGAQLVTKGKWAKTVLHLRLLFAHVPNCTIRKTEWTRAPATSQKGGFLTNMSTAFTQSDALPTTEPAELNSGVCPDGPPVPVQSRKLLKFVDMAEVVRGAHNAPGHWLVTAAKLVKEDGKIGLQVKFALLNYVSGTETMSS
ncbi:hypothetical protein BHE74_00047599 [Ensete ventricosum]|nr:hypothetical protein GW17_00032356 [Ensete ventricosum]RWW46473.1 hypothetical protein BHE74_00047599 [Ensete ventricosum]